MKNILLILLLGIIVGQNQNFDLFNQTVSEE